MYLNENRVTAVALVRALAQEATDPYPIRDILDKGYEDSFEINDVMSLGQDFETIVTTPMIETATDWDQPFEDHDFGASVSGILDGIGIDDDLASDFRHSLAQQCLYLVEERGKSKPQSGFVDKFGHTVFDAFQPKLEEKRAEAQQYKRDLEQEIERKRERLQLLDRLLEDRLEFEKQFERHWRSELEQQLVSDLREPWGSLHHWLTEQHLELERLLELQQTRYRDLDSHQRELEEEDVTDIQELLGDILNEAIEEAVPLIAVWIKETIEAEGESLVFDALARMSS